MNFSLSFKSQNKPELMYRTETAAGDQVEISFEGNKPLLNGSPINWSLIEEKSKRYLISKDHKNFKCEVLKLDQLTKTVEIKINKNIINYCILMTNNIIQYYLFLLIRNFMSRYFGKKDKKCFKDISI